MENGAVVGWMLPYVIWEGQSAVCDTPSELGSEHIVHLKNILQSGDQLLIPKNTTRS